MYAKAMGTQTNKELFLDGFVKIVKEQQADVLLKACYNDEEAAISAHKLILFARSEVFKKMFESDNFKASLRLESTTLSELKQEELEALVEFVYSDGSMLSEKGKQHVRSLYHAADKYEIPHLLLVLAQVPSDKALSNATINVIKAQKYTISNSKEFEGFVVDHPNLTVEKMKAISPTSYYCGHCCR
ncbi:hypothetical protein N665_0625s0007 [Sinapis alba]|nr:hypothetical protein N665_0625s0007 [Sinapis alba]